MKTLSLVGVRSRDDNTWRYGMDYEMACRKWKQEHYDLNFLRMRLNTATIPEYEKVLRNIESREKYIKVLERWFKLTGNKIPKIA